MTFFGGGGQWGRGHTIAGSTSPTAMLRHRVSRSVLCSASSEQQGRCARSKSDGGDVRRWEDNSGPPAPPFGELCSSSWGGWQGHVLHAGDRRPAWALQRLQRLWDGTEPCCVPLSITGLPAAQIFRWHPLPYRGTDSTMECDTLCRLAQAPARPAWALRRWWGGSGSKQTQPQRAPPLVLPGSRTTIGLGFGSSPPQGPG